MLQELKTELGDLNEINFALQLMRADRLSEQEGDKLERNIVGLLTYFLSLDTELNKREVDFKKEMIGKVDENEKKYPANRISIEWESTDDGKRRFKLKNQIRITEEQLKSVRNYNYYLRSEKKI